MTARECFKRTLDKDRFEVGDNYFVLMSWTGESGSTSGPHLVTVYGDAAVEIGKDGSFGHVFPSSADGYAPFLPKRRGPRKEILQSILTQVIQLVGSN